MKNAEYFREIANKSTHLRQVQDQVDRVYGEILKAAETGGYTYVESLEDNPYLEKLITDVLLKFTENGFKVDLVVQMLTTHPKKEFVISWR